MFSVLIFVLILSFLIFIHELGHYLAAVRSGVVVEEFGIGYPPRAIKLFTWRGTDFTLNWIPFGGFVKMAGEQVEFEEVHTKEEQEKLQKKDKGQFFAADTRNKLMIILAGATFNFIFGIIAFTIVFSRLGIPEPIETPRIGEVMPNTPAAEAGLTENTEIQQITVADQVFTTASRDDVIDVIAQNSGQEAVIATTGTCQGYSCEEVWQEFNVYLRTTEETPEGEGSLGIIFQPVAFVAYPWYEMPYKSMWYGLQQAIFLGEQIVFALGDMISGMIFGGRVPGDVAGPIGIVHQAQATGMLSEGFITTLSFAGMLSINLAIINILPIPPLDGGRAVFIILERFISERHAKPLEYYMNYGGYILLLMLIVLITARDIWRIFQ